MATGLAVFFRFGAAAAFFTGGSGLGGRFGERTGDRENRARDESEEESGKFHREYGPTLTFPTPTSSQ